MDTGSVRALPQHRQAGWNIMEGSRLSSCVKDLSALALKATRASGSRDPHRVNRTAHCSSTGIVRSIAISGAHFRASLISKLAASRF